MVLCAGLIASACALPHAALRGSDGAVDGALSAQDAEQDSGVEFDSSEPPIDAHSPEDVAVVDTGVVLDAPTVRDVTDPPDAPCGRGGQPCCPGPTCAAGLQCVAGLCRACGATNQPCCGSGCAAGNTCEVGTCRSCGRPGEPCCGGSCATPHVCVANGGSSICLSPGCGGLWQACCAGCRTGTCAFGRVCATCGGDGEPCFPGVCDCRDGRVCNASGRCR